MVCCFGLGAAVIATIARLIERVPFIAIVAMLVMIVAVVLLLIVANLFNLHRIGTPITLIFLGDVLFPFVFFTNGGIDSGMAVYFALSIILIFLLARGRMRIGLLTVNIAVMLAIYIYTYFDPDIAVSLNLFQRSVDHIQSILVTGFFVGFVIVFQNRIYLAEKKKTETAKQEVAKQDELLHVLNVVATTLLTAEAGQFEGTLRKSMELLARNADADRAYIWKNRVENDALCYVQEFEWLDGATPRQEDAVRAKASFSYTKSLPSWEALFRSNQIVNGPIRTFPPVERERLEPYGVKSVLSIPVFLQNEFWGFISFDDCREERAFSEDAVDILRSGSLLIANAFARHEMTNNLVRAREDALSSARAKSDFLANMSHEIRTPMNAVIGMTSIGKSASDIERKDYCFGKIEDASTHLLGVINDILDMSKIEANKFELSPTEFNFEKLLQRVVNVVNFRVDEKQQKFTVHFDTSVPRAMIGDDQRRAQVITNLLGNAVKFTPEHGAISLNARLKNEEDGRLTLQIEVTDTGIGVSAEQKSRLFQSFEQAESSTTRKFGGTGLGLAISKRIVEMMGGEIWVESAPGAGSTFAFTVQTERGAEEKRGLLAPGVNWESIRVLAVDDEPDVRAYFMELAQRMSLSCDVAASGEEALARIEQNGGYDIYFVDWRMPGMNGIDLTRKIKERASGNSVVIMISATEWSVIEGEAKSAGVDKFLPKPLFPSSIADLINECCGLGGLPAEDTRQDENGIFAGYHILMAEDVEINREIVLALLEPTLLAIDCAENGAKAVRMFCESPEKYDMIFMDLQMPEMDGYEATRQIRAQSVPRAAKIPIIAMTANVFREDVERCLEAGMNGHVGKPLNLDEVIAALRKYLPR
jgi:signal transduction histidine kinase/CheY-like chemotaxis protein